MSDSTALVRIKPYNARKGNLTRSFSFRGLLFKEEAGWHRVDASVADYLERSTTDGHPDSPLVFDVALDEDDAREIEEKAKRAATRATAEKPHRLDFSSKAPDAESSRTVTSEDANPRRSKRADSSKRTPAPAPVIVDKTGPADDIDEDDDLDEDDDDGLDEPPPAPAPAPPAARPTPAVSAATAAAKLVEKAPTAKAPAETPTVEIPGAPKKGK